MDLSSERILLTTVASPPPRTTWLTWLVRGLTWWNGATINTLVHTWRNGERVGSDEFGNVYYRTKGGAIDPALGFERRWVIFARESDGSLVPPGWYGWLRQLTDDVPGPYTPRSWEKPHEPNMTGTPAAYRPPGSVLRSGTRPKTGGDYEAWTPK